MEIFRHDQILRQRTCVIQVILKNIDKDFQLLDDCLVIVFHLATKIKQIDINIYYIYIYIQHGYQQIC